MVSELTSRSSAGNSSDSPSGTARSLLDRGYDWLSGTFWAAAVTESPSDCALTS
jgi:hypothetical protein